MNHPPAISLPPLTLSFFGLSDTFPLSSVPLRGPVTQQSLNHRFEVSLLCLEKPSKLTGREKEHRPQDLWVKVCSAVAVNTVLHSQEAPPVVGPPSRV